MLKTKQKVKLRSLAMTLRPIFQIGKDGLSDNLIIGLNDALEAHELIKISVLKNCTLNIKEVAFDIASKTNSELIQIIGRNIVFYRQSKKQLIEL
jgi:RNA-binding protein